MEDNSSIRFHSMSIQSELPVLNHTDRWTPEAIQRLSTLSLIMIMTFVGNVTLIVVLTSSTKYRTLNRRVNVFFVNLAAGDLTVCFFTMTSEVLFVVHEKTWILGDAACRGILYVQIVTLASTTFILTAMSIDRYLVISWPLKFGTATGSSRAGKMILASWTMALVFAIPQLFVWKQKEVGVYADGQVKYECKSDGYTAWWQRKTYFTLMAMYLLVLPTFIISFCYFKVVRAVWNQAKQSNDPTSEVVKARWISSLTPLQPLDTPEEEDRDAKPPVVAAAAAVLAHKNSPVSPRSSGGTKRILPRAKIQTIKMTLSIICCFIMCWTPYFVTHLIHIWSEYTDRIPEAVYAFADTVALLNSALNPILYACFTVKLKRGLGNLFCACLRRRRSCCAPRMRGSSLRRMSMQPAPPTRKRSPNLHVVGVHHRGTSCPRPCNIPLALRWEVESNKRTERPRLHLASPAHPDRSAKRRHNGQCQL